MRHESTLFGWSFRQWRAVADWAGVDLNLARAFHAVVSGESAEELLTLRQKWLDAGGPNAGPGSIILEAA